MFKINISEKSGKTYKFELETEELLGKELKDKIQGKVPSGHKRSTSWPKVRAEHLKASPDCAVCGSVKKVEVHHIKPFHMAPELELDPTNFITLCESKKNGVTCHQFVGHLGNYKTVNLTVKEDALYWREKLKNRDLCGRLSLTVEVIDEIK